MTSKWKSCICKGPQRRAWNRWFSRETWSEGNVARSQPAKKKQPTPLDTTKDTCSLRDGRLGFPYAKVTPPPSPLSPPSGWRWASRTKRTTRGESELPVAGRRLFDVWLWFPSGENHRLWCDSQGEAGAPGQQGTEGARGDRGVQVGGVVWHLGLVKIVACCWRTGGVDSECRDHNSRVFSGSPNDVKLGPILVTRCLLYEKEHLLAARQFANVHTLRFSM